MIAASTTIRTPITAQASSSPPASASSVFPPSSRLCFAKASVTAVEETRPPERPVTAVPRCEPRARVAT